MRDQWAIKEAGFASVCSTRLGEAYAHSTPLLYLAILTLNRNFQAPLRLTQVATTNSVQQRSKRFSQRNHGDHWRYQRYQLNA